MFKSFGDLAANALCALNASDLGRTGALQMWHDLALVVILRVSMPQGAALISRSP